MHAVILCYHKVAPVEVEGRRLSVEPRLMESHIRLFKRRNKRFVCARDFAPSSLTDSVCFTFDDCYDSTLTWVPRLLESAGVRGTFYAVSSLLGKTSSWDGPLASPLADLEALSTAAKRGHEIGNHCATHPRLSKLSKTEQVVELERCHQTLEEAGIACRTVCYPYGDYNSDTLEAVRIMGYRVGMSLRKGPVTAADDLLELPRIAVAHSDGIAMLLYKIHLRPTLRQLHI